MKYIRKNGIKDPGSAITHGTALILAVVGTLPLLLKAAREPDHLHVVAMAVFMLSMILLYLASTVYHTFDVNGKVNRRLKKFDHMMISVLMRAKRILLLLSGSGKAEITERLLCGRIVPQVPATILRLHPDVTAVIDEDALQLVRAHAPNLIP